MVYQLNQNTQLGSVTDEMLQKLMDKKAKNEGEEQIDQQRDRQLDKEEIERVRLQGVKDHEKKLHEEEYNNLKERDHKLALNILVEEKKSLEAQLTEYKLMIRNHEVGRSELSDVEIAGVYRLYEHLMLQKKELDTHIARFDKKIAEKLSRDEDKERLIKMLVKKYSDTL